MSFNPFLRRREHKDTQSKAYWKSDKLTRQSAKLLGGRTILASGSLGKKGDIEIPSVARIEHKATQKKSFSVTLDMVGKIEAAAIGSGEIPAVEVDFLDAECKVVAKVAVVPFWVLELLCAGK